MKLQIMSDLHLEMHADRGAEFIRSLDPTGVDVLVLAGDVTMARQYEDLENVFKLLARKYRHILYVPGNHEYCKSSPKQVARNLARLAKDIPEVEIPDNGAVVIAGQRFIGGTMWFRPDPMGEMNKRFMNDFSLIEDFEPWVLRSERRLREGSGHPTRSRRRRPYPPPAHSQERPPEVRPRGDQCVLRIRHDLVPARAAAEALDPRAHP